MSRWLSRLLVLALSLALTLAIATLMLCQVLAVGVRYGPSQSLVLCVGALGTGLLLVAAHEVGHLLAGRVARLSLAQLTVGLLTVRREGGRLRWQLNTDWFRPAAFVRHASGTARPWQVALMVVGGPLANLSIAAVCLVLAGLLSAVPPAKVAPAGNVGWSGVPLLRPGGLGTAWLNVAGLQSLWLGLGALLPSREAGLRTDGGQLLDLLRSR